MLWQDTEETPDIDATDVSLLDVAKAVTYLSHHMPSESELTGECMYRYTSGVCHDPLSSLPLLAVAWDMRAVYMFVEATGLEEKPSAAELSPSPLKIN